MTLPLKRLAVADDAMGQLDHLFISHFHGTEDGFRYLEDATGYLSSSPSQSSLASVVQKPSRSMPQVGDTQPQNIPLEVCRLYFKEHSPYEKGAFNLVCSLVDPKDLQSHH